MHCTDEAYFYLTESIIKRNKRMWWNKRGLDREAVAWCESFGLVCYFLPKNLRTLLLRRYRKVNQHTYLDMLKIIFGPKHYQVESHKKYYFQQDGASSYGLYGSRVVTNKFGEKFMTKKQWSPQSQYLNPCDYFLWGYLLKYISHYRRLWII